MKELSHISFNSDLNPEKNMKSSYKINKKHLILLYLSIEWNKLETENVYILY